MLIENIIDFFKKKFNKKDCLLIGLIVFIFFLTRLINIEKFPIFNDEGIYIQWSKTAWHDASWRFISLTDGKQPLQTWATIPLLKLFPNNALLAGRLFAVLTGFVAMVGMFCLLFYVFSKKTAYIGSLLYIFTPYFLFYDRLALADSAVNAAFIWILFFSILLAKNMRLDIALIFGLIGGIALLTKSSAQVFLILGALIGPSLFIDFKAKKNVIKVINFYFLYLVVGVLATVIYNVQRLSPFLHFVAEKNKVFLLSFDEFIKSPFMLLWHNLITLPLYVSWEMGFALALTGLIGLGLLLKKKTRLFIFFSAWTILLYIGVSFFTRILFPRYLIFFASLMLLTTAYLLIVIKNKMLISLSVIILVGTFMFFDYPILFNETNIPFPPVDRGQYLEGWTAGWGIKDIMDFARDKSHIKPVVILAEGDFGMTGDVLNVYMKRNDRIFIKGYWPLTEKEIAANIKELDKSLVYVVISHQDFPSFNSLTLINKYEKPGNKSTIYLFELKK